ncbi:hypothetical protein BGZ97_007789 [Linnemannia gamsii]|jgi:hypothetical protein|uniref:Uncharacterized protein n=1 Tax=Linnemannia gamsii TaxID=64522 RepID=A0A9P6QPR0_9FUNG|nr:hypothetical protein BGZ97_007789 [Linnemannia gamsii]
MARITDLPEEVIALVGIHLNKNAVKFAIRTCWHLHNALNHLLWRQLTLPSRTGRFLLSAAKIKENAHHIQQLEFRCHVPQEYYSIHYPKVHNLTMVGTSPPPPRTVSPETQLHHHPLLISLNPQFQVLTLRNIDCSSSSNLWETICATLQHPKRLEVRFLGTMDKGVSDSFWRTCSRFEELNLDVLEAECGETLPSLMFPDLKRLKLYYGGCFRHAAMDMDDHLEWMKNAPNLEALEWRVGHYRYFPIGDLITALAGKAWPRLESFSLLFLPEPDDVWADIINVLPPLKRFQSNNRQFKEQSFARLQETQFETLRCLHVRDCVSFSSPMAFTVLVECVQLEEFHAPYIHAADLRSKDSTGSDWACTGLRFLRLQVFTEKDDTGADELVFKQLSKLSQLKDLRLNKSSTAAYPATTQAVLEQKGMLRLQLDTGLSYLSTLKHLTKINFLNTEQEMGADDVQWMLENWTSLEFMAGSFSEDADTQDELENMFWETSVDYWPVDFVFDD